MTNPPRNWKFNADGSLVCPHRDLTVCPVCSEQKAANVVDVSGAFYWVADLAERAELLAELDAIRAECA